MRSNGGAEFVFFDTKSRQWDGKLGHRASLFPGSPCLPRPELFIRLGEVTHTSIIYCASLVSSYPCRRHCCENPKGELHWARRSSRLTVTQHFATAAHCDRICISWIGNYQVETSVTERGAEFKSFCKWLSVCGLLFGAAALKKKTLYTPQNMGFAVGRFNAESTQSPFVISSLNTLVESILNISIQLELSTICLEQQVVVSIPREYSD